MLTLNLNHFANPQTRWQVLAITTADGPLDARILSNEAARLVAHDIGGEAVLALSSAFADIDRIVLRELFDAALAETGVAHPSDVELWAFEVRVRLMGWRDAAELDALARSIFFSSLYVDGPFASETARETHFLAQNFDELAPEWDYPPANPAARDNAIARAILNFQSGLAESLPEHIDRITRAPA